MNKENTQAQAERIGEVVRVPDGDFFVDRGCGTNTSYYEISKEEYDRITAIEGWKGKLTAEYEERMSDAIRWGYGFYGCGLWHDTSKDKYYYNVTIGSSCD